MIPMLSVNFHLQTELLPAYVAQPLLGSSGSNMQRSPVSKITNQSYLFGFGQLFPTLWKYLSLKVQLKP